MGSITISGIDDGLMDRLPGLRRRGGESVGILTAAVPYVHPAPENLAEAIRSIFEPLGGVELELPARGFASEGPWFGWEEECGDKHDNS